ncbi:hypothetical protein B0H13DRAFT_2345072 [Mycena leptocephala]|nr:hypothetical protein B0H13DRAFT_2345072 [Mycena leptocephala]
MPRCIADFISQFWWAFTKLLLLLKRWNLFRWRKLPNGSVGITRPETTSSNPSRQRLDQRVAQLKRERRAKFRHVFVRVTTIDLVIAIFLVFAIIITCLVRWWRQRQRDKGMDASSLDLISRLGETTLHRALECRATPYGWMLNSDKGCLRGAARRGTVFIHDFLSILAYLASAGLDKGLGVTFRCMRIRLGGSPVWGPYRI